MTKLTDRLEALFQPHLKPMGLSIVRILLMGKKRMTLQVMIERMDDTPLSMDACVEASRKISDVLDVEDPIEFTYGLEVTSPGLDRPLLKPQDFKRFTGSRIHVTLLAPKEDGLRKYNGVLGQATDDFFELDLLNEASIIRIAYVELGQAKLDPDFKFKNVSKG